MGCWYIKHIDFGFWINSVVLVQNNQPRCHNNPPKTSRVTLKTTIDIPSKLPRKKVWSAFNAKDTSFVQRTPRKGYNTFESRLRHNKNQKHTRVLSPATHVLELRPAREAILPRVDFPHESPRSERIPSSYGIHEKQVSASHERHPRKDCEHFLELIYYPWVEVRVIE